jgi:hypothetical protein
VGFLTKMNYLSQEMQCKLQILQPLSVDGVNFRELGSESRLLERSFRRAVSRQELIGEANSLSELQNLAAGDRGAFRPFSLLLFDRLIGGEKSGLRVKAHVLEQVCPPLSLTVPVYLLRRTRWVLLIPMGLAPDSQQALFLGIWLSLGQSKCFLFFQMCLPGRDPTTWCPYCVHTPKASLRLQTAGMHNSPPPSLWQQATAAWLSCLRGCSFHSPSREGTVASLLLAHSPR